jgi:ribosomal protein S18 acetylase RimI-like enzyme
MSAFAAEPFADGPLQVVDLDSVRVSELEVFFNQELAQWRERLLWDVSGALAALRRALERGGVNGKAIRCGPSTVGYAYFIVEGGRGVVTGLSVAPGWRGAGAAKLLVRAVVSELRRRGVARIESQFVSFDSPWLVSCFEGERFRSFWREFRRLNLPRPRAVAASTAPLALQPWKSFMLTEASLLMQSAHAGGADARMNEMYRTAEGCRALLTNVLRHRGCGSAIPAASVVARHGGTQRTMGFAIVTETSSKQAHLAQLAVAPSFQSQGIGRRLLDHCIDRLLDLGFDTLSLMVSRDNERAVRLYRSVGFEPVLRFPIFRRDPIS